LGKIPAYPSALFHLPWPGYAAAGCILSAPAMPFCAQTSKFRDSKARDNTCYLQAESSDVGYKQVQVNLSRKQNVS
jgi:hypothetical protein